MGMTLGGGIDSLQGLHGLHRLLLDSLETVRLVTAMGGLIEVSDTKYPELCVGLPFAGSNLGVVTTATCCTHRATNGGLVTNVNFIFVATEHAAILQALSSVDETLPSELKLTPAVAYNRTIGQVSIGQDDSSSTTVLIMGKPLVPANTICYGPQKQALGLLSPFNSLLPVMSRSYWLSRTDTFAWEFGPSHAVIGYGSSSPTDRDAYVRGSQPQRFCTEIDAQAAAISSDGTQEPVLKTQSTPSFKNLAAISSIPAASTNWPFM
ncbi:hypothetical protein BO79DRAFT_253338 [Aspergillus costaricaensis CBS 115574]|uniref:Uncharacterized protein n=1 Tax=Aspergillus costaricaensis CBS 115574 TaxID=1448317 RepID=A0ACD1IIW8_9EURO|nr:hypothetical protein BO79DRAFT_253338 [Aspergillus costaricaensis CBS 115574]RAK90555.1 hypothetical protein BO79DRAFT_253338 [Aspergillus costaricaensis CBS 115574]